MTFFWLCIKNKSAWEPGKNSGTKARTGEPCQHLLIAHCTPPTWTPVWRASAQRPPHLSRPTPVPAGSLQEKPSCYGSTQS